VLTETLVFAPLGIARDTDIATIRAVLGPEHGVLKFVIVAGRPSVAAEASDGPVLLVPMGSPTRLIGDWIRYWREIRSWTSKPDLRVCLWEGDGWVGSQDLLIALGLRLLGVRCLTRIDANGRTRAERIRISGRDVAGALAGNARALQRIRTLPDRIGEPPARTSSLPIRQALYLRADLALAVHDEPGGSRSHGEGVIGGLQENGVSVITATPVALGAAGRTPPHWIDTRAPIVRNHQPELAEAAHDMRIQSVLRHVDISGVDVVYQRYSLFSTSGLDLARRLGVPLVLEVNASEVRFRIQYGSIRFRRLASRFENALFTAASLVVVVSERVAEEVREIAPAARVVVVPNAVDVDAFHVSAERALEARAALGVAKRDVLVGFFGRFYPWHGIDVLTDAAPGLLNDWPEIKLLLVGDGGRRDQAERALRPWGDRVIFTGIVPHENVPPLMAGCDILVSPHARIEGFVGSPMKVFEYLASGRAIVASRLEQIGDVIDDGRTGLLVDPGAADELARAVGKLVSDPSLRDALGRAARADAVVNHSWAQRVRLVLDAVRTDLVHGG
jgi:glycosyltransferase involved in cell wall biosynthesis